MNVIRNKIKLAKYNKSKVKYKAVWIGDALHHKTKGLGNIIKTEHIYLLFLSWHEQRAHFKSQSEGRSKNIKQKYLFFIFVST